MAIQGMFAQLLFKAAPFDDAAAWAPVNIVRDVTVTAEAGEADVTTRGNSGFRQTIAGLREITLEFEMVWEPGDAAFEAIRNAFLPPGALVAFAALDSAGASGDGPVGDFAITNFSRSEPLEEAISVSVTAKLARWGQWTQTGAP